MSLANQWRVKAREAAVEASQDLELPSGMVIRARRVSPMFLATRGQLPLSLAVIANPQKAGAAPGGEKSVDLMAFMRDVLIYAVVEPAISLTPGPDEIHPAELPDADVEFILRWAAGGEEAASLESFRRKRNDGGSVHDGGDIRAKAESNAGDQG